MSEEPVGASSQSDAVSEEPVGASSQSVAVSVEPVFQNREGSSEGRLGQGVPGPGEGFSGDPPSRGRDCSEPSSSSQDPFCHLLLSPREETGASSSHGMPGVLPTVCYEDYFLADDHPAFPLVGTWTLVHFLVHVLDVAGCGVLAFLGDRAEEWRMLRATSCFLRQALAAAVAALFRVGPYAVVFQGPQDFLAAEHYICRGELLGYDAEPTASSSLSAQAGPEFPQVFWGPPYTVHYLWRLFAQHGYHLLCFLGDRVSDWFVLRGVASGFRACVVYGLMLWLERTGRRYRSRYLTNAENSQEAAQAYLRTGQRVFPYELAPEDTGRRDDPEVLVDQEGSSDESSEDSGSSTTEPSAYSATESSEGVPVLTDPSGSRPLEREVERPVVRYAAAEGALVVFYGDDCFEVPLEGWPVGAIQVIVEGLETGDWSGWQEALQSVLRPRTEEAGPSERLQIIRYGHLWGRWARFWALVAVLLGVLIWGLQGVGAVTVKGEDWHCVSGDPLSLESQALQLRSEEGSAVAWVEESSDCEGTTWWLVVLCCLLIGAWEITKYTVSRITRGSGAREQGTQTSDLNIVPMPLPPGVRSRARILYNLWRAGYRIQADEYPERIRAVFDGLVGDWLVRNDEGLISSPSSSD